MAATYRPEMATSASRNSPVKTERTRPPLMTRSAGSSPRATANRRAMSSRKPGRSTAIPCHAAQGSPTPSPGPSRSGEDPTVCCGFSEDHAPRPGHDRYAGVVTPGDRGGSGPGLRPEATARAGDPSPVTPGQGPGDAVLLFVDSNQGLVRSGDGAARRPRTVHRE